MGPSNQHDILLVSECNSSARGLAETSDKGKQLEEAVRRVGQGMTNPCAQAK